MADNSLLNMINVELAELRAKQLKKALDLVEMKKLESLLNMRKTLHSTPELDDPHSLIDEDAFSNEDIIEFLDTRKKNNEKSKPKAKAKRKKATSKATTKTPKKRTKKVS